MSGARKIITCIITAIFLLYFSAMALNGSVLDLKQMEQTARQTINATLGISAPPHIIINISEHIAGRGTIYAAYTIRGNRYRITLAEKTIAEGTAKGLTSYQQALTHEMTHLTLSVYLGKRSTVPRSIKEAIALVTADEDQARLPHLDKDLAQKCAKMRQLAEQDQLKAYVQGLKTGKY